MWSKLNVDIGFSWLSDTWYYTKGETAGRKYSPNVSNTFHALISFAVPIRPKKYEVLHTSLCMIYTKWNHKNHTKIKVSEQLSIARKHNGMEFKLPVVLTMWSILSEMTYWVTALLAPRHTRASERQCQHWLTFQFQALNFKVSASMPLGSDTPFTACIIYSWGR